MLTRRSQKKRKQSLIINALMIVKIFLILRVISSTKIRRNRKKFCKNSKQQILIRNNKFRQIRVKFHLNYY